MNLNYSSQTALPIPLPPPVTANEAGGSASAHACDVGNQKEVISTFGQLAKQGPLNILLNNAGVSHIGNVEATSEHDFDHILRVNVKGYYNCIYACIGPMKAQGGGVILNIASIAGIAGIADRFAYSASKGAVIALTYSVARDYVAHNIRCKLHFPRARPYAICGRLLKQKLPRARARNV